MIKTLSLVSMRGWSSIDRGRSPPIDRGIRGLLPGIKAGPKPKTPVFMGICSLTPI